MDYFEVVDVDNPGTFTVNANGSDTTIEAVLTDNTQSITLNFNNTTAGDPDVVFNTETSFFQYFGSLFVMQIILNVITR